MRNAPQESQRNRRWTIPLSGSFSHSLPPRLNPTHLRGTTASVVGMLGTIPGLTQSVEPENTLPATAAALT